MSRLTLRHIADQLGVSTATVSLAMRGSTKISSNTRKRVEAALAKSGYVYQRSAAGLRTSKTHTIGVIINDISDPFFSTLLASLEDALTKTGRTVFLCNTNECVSRQRNFLQRMLEYNADGIIISPAIGSTSEDFHPKVANMPPMVFVSRAMFGLDFDFIVNADYDAALLSTQRLIELGHRRIALVGGDPSASPFGERLRAYREALDQASIRYEDALVLPSLPTRVAGYQTARRIVDLNPRPSAACCYNDATALGLMAGLQRESLFPGKNFALIGHEDIEEASMSNPGLSTTTVSRDEMGEKAAAALVERIENRDVPPKRIVLETKLMVRGSCGLRLAPDS